MMRKENLPFLEEIFIYVIEKLASSVFFAGHGVLRMTV